MPPVSKSAAASQAPSRSPSPAAARSAARSARAGEDRAEVHGHVAELDLGEAAQARGDERAVLGVALDDEAAAVASAAGLDEAGLAEDAEALAHRDQRDAEPAGELGLARQPLAGVQHAEHDAVGEALRDLLGAPGVGELGEHGFACARSHPRLHAIRLTQRIAPEWRRAQKIIQDRRN